MKIQETAKDTQGNPITGLLWNFGMQHALEEKYHKPLLQIIKDHGTKPLIQAFACVKCGEYPLSASILVYYKYDIEKLHCYQCQGKEVRIKI